MDETVYRISESFKAGDQTPFQDKIVKIRNLIEGYTENILQLVEKGDFGSNSLKAFSQSNEIEEPGKLSKVDAQTKIIKTLEDKLIVTEK